MFITGEEKYPGPSCSKGDNATHQIKLYPLDSTIIVINDFISYLSTGEGFIQSTALFHVSTIRAWYFSGAHVHACVTSEVNQG